MSADRSEQVGSRTRTDRSPEAGDRVIVDLALVSHTNVGKTTLARTLLRRDIGEVRDRAHVTEVPEAHPLIESADGDELRLWDTPGFGDSARLLRRLEGAGNPLGWFLSEVWDRFTDRPFWSSQQAMRTVRDACDVVLYLVNAGEDPASAGYVEAEMRILGWMGKPVVLMLNQTGPPRGAEADAADAYAWRTHLARWPLVRAVIGLDAFARCWVQEDALLVAVAAVLDPAKGPAFGRLRAQWRERNLLVFAEAMQALAAQLATAAVDAESVPAPARAGVVRAIATSLGRGAAAADPDTEKAMNALALRLDGAVRSTTDALIRLHGLSGSAADEILARVSGQFDVRRPADAGKAGLIGGVVSGALGGLAADLAAGGLTFGAGALIGGILGALGGGGAAKAYNLARAAETGRVRWSADFLQERLVAAQLRYLAVAHFGRGRGDWVQGEYPAHWRGVVDEAVAPYADRLGEIWAQAAGGASADAVSSALAPIVQDIGREVLVRLYPEAEALLGDAELRGRPEDSA